MKKLLLLVVVIGLFTACNELSIEEPASVDLKSGKALGQQSVTFSFLQSVDIGETGAAEISAYDPLTKNLFVVNNTIDDDDNVIFNRIDVVNLSDPSIPEILTPMFIAGGKFNSVDVMDGMLAIAVENDIKTMNGQVVVFNTYDLNNPITEIEVGALPDMVTFTPDGKYILTANEGEPNSEYTEDPIGTVSIISVGDWTETRLDFASFESQKEDLMLQGFRIFGKDASFAQDIEPEYIAVAENSKKAWVSLQENNAIAEIDLLSKRIVKIMPLGFKDYSLEENAIDPSNEDGGVYFNTWPVFGMYQPDGIAVLAQGNTPFIFSANEGDSRDYDGFSEEKRIKKIDLDPTAFPDAAFLKEDENLGRLNITTTLGDTDNDGDYDELYSYGARSFSIWNGNTGKQIYDSKNFLDMTAYDEGCYDDGRSDDKGSEPESVLTARIGNKDILFVGMERVDAVAVYDVTNPVKPEYLQWLNVGDAPEGLEFVPAEESPNGQTLLIVSSEGDGVVTIFSIAEDI